MIATLDELAAALVQAQSFPLRKNSFTLAANQTVDLFHMGDGFPPNAPVTASGLNGEFMDNTKAGAIPFKDSLIGATTNVGRISMIATLSNLFAIADRIWNNFVDMAAAGTAKQDIAWPSGVQRYADGVGVELYASVTTALANATPATWTVEFINQNDELQVATASYAGSGEVGQMIPFDLPAGSTGVKSLVSFQASVAQAAGGIELVLCKRILDLPLVNFVPSFQDGITLGLPQVQPGACLFMMSFRTANGATPVLNGKLDIVQG